MKELNFEDKRKKIKLEINGERYEIPFQVSVGDALVFMKEANNDNPDYKRVYCEMVRRKILRVEAEKPDIDVVIEAIDVDRDRLFNEILNIEIEIKEEYNRFIDEEDPYTRFAKAVIAYENKKWKELVDAIDLTPLATNFSKIMQPLTSLATTVREMMISVGEKIKKVVEAIQIPNLTEEEKEEMLNSHKNWGEFGWTMIPNAPFAFLISVLIL